MAVFVPAAPAQAGVVSAKDSSAEGAPDREGGRLGVGRRNDPRLPTNATATAAAGSGRDRERRSPRHAAHARSNKPAWVLPEQCSGHPTGSDGSRRPPVRRHQPRHRSGSEMPLAAVRRHRERLDPGGLREGAGRRGERRSGGRAGESPAPESCRSSGCSLTTSRLQRLATGAFPSKACDVSAWRAQPGVASSGDPSP